MSDSPSRLAAVALAPSLQRTDTGCVGLRPRIEMATDGRSAARSGAVGGGAVGGGAVGGGARAGFTILEIMIATAILTLGLVSVLALFPAAIHTGKQVMDTSSAVVVAESVAEAIREGMRNQMRAIDGPQGTNNYFIFQHDGVNDRVPNDRRLEKPRSDYYILLPRFPSRGGGTFSGAGRRMKAFQRGKVFVYPETDPLANGNGDPLLADNDGDDFEGEYSSGRGFRDIKVEKVYKLGQLFPGFDVEGEDVLPDQQIEPLKQYSFAFAVRVSYFDANVTPSGGSQYEPGNVLYNFHIMVFRNFFPPEPGKRSKHQEPVFEINFEVAR